MKKKVLSVLMAGILVLGMGICTASAKAETKIDKVTIKKETVSQEFKNKAGEVVYTTDYEKPVLDGDANAIKAINAVFEKEAASVGQIQEEDLEFLKKEFPGYSKTVYTVGYNRNGLLSIMHETVAYTGGAHPNYTRCAHTFDINTGKELGLSDIFAISEAEFSRIQLAKFKNTIKKAPDHYFEEALDTVKKEAGFKNNFYLKDNNVCIYYDTYDLAPYATIKFPAVGYSYDQADWFKIPLK